METYKCALCAKEFPHFQYDGFASESDGNTLQCFYGSVYDMDIFKWQDLKFSLKGHLCDDCISLLIKLGFFEKEVKSRTFYSELYK